MTGFRLPRGVLRSPLSGSIRARVVALGLIAAIPAVGMAGIIAGRDYDSRERVAVEHVDRVQALAVARIDVTVAGMAALLGSISDRLTDPASCDALLQTEFRHLAPATPGLALFAASGALVCASGAANVFTGQTAATAGWFRDARDGAAPVLGVAGAAGLPIVAMGRPGGVLVALLPMDWFTRVQQHDPETPAEAVWLLDSDGAIIAANGLTAEALPAVGTLVRLNSAIDETVLAPSAGGAPYAYAATRLANGWRVIGAYGSAREHMRAKWVLYTRLADLAILLLLGLAVTVLGADIAFGGPLRRLRAALADWQGGAAFDPRDLESAPTELVELARSFHQATISLGEQKEELERAKTRQGLLMLEIHHRVKNNLQIVASLLNLQASRIRVPEARAEFQAARDRIRALATLHRHLYSEGEIHTINMPSFLNELCGQLFQAMGEAPGGRIKLHIAAEEIRLSTDQAVPLALIVTEAITNAIKYGFPAERTGTISIELAQHASAIDLVIADDGVGIPPGRSETETGTRDGIGLQLIRGFSRQLGATLVVSQSAGTHYSIHMPLRPRSAEGETEAELAEAV